MPWNANWKALEGKVEGDCLPLVLESAKDRSRRFADGVITKVTPTSVSFTMEGAEFGGEVVFPPGKLRTRETFGKVALDGTWYRFRVATDED